MVIPAYRQALTDAKKQNHGLMERLQAMQNEVSDSEVRGSELEGQIRQLENVSPQNIHSLSAMYTVEFG